jgi:hypothetical protein
MTPAGWKLVAGIVGIMVIVAYVIGYAILSSNTSNLSARVTQLEHKSTQQAATIVAQQKEINGMKASVAAASKTPGTQAPTGSVATCADLRNLQHNIPLQGTDQASGGTVKIALIGQPWVPLHCLR